MSTALCKMSGLLLLVLTVCGCGGSGAQADALLVSNKPVEGSNTTSYLASQNRDYPTAPGQPQGAWTAALKSRPPLRELLRRHEESLVTSEPSPWDDDRPHRLKGPLGKLLDHDEDYKWIQGIVEMPSPGVTLLRYTSGQPDTWGGKVSLCDHPHLTTIQEGDIVFVEGHLIQENERPVFGQWYPYPRYQIQYLLLVQRAD